MVGKFRLCSIALLVSFLVLFLLVSSALSGVDETRTESPPVSAGRTGIAEKKDAQRSEGDAGSERGPSVTRHSIDVAGSALQYEATADYLPIGDASGGVKAKIFFTAYIAAPRKGEAARPVTFAFNGGPGASSLWLHLGGLGPKVVPTEEDGSVLPPPPVLKDNPYTWLSFTDLVFIDPVGTGFSRVTPGEDAKQFYGVDGDIESVGEFIRLYCTRYGRWLSPKFIVGESYGTTRAAGLAGYLQDKVHMLLNGIVLVSPVLNFQTISFGRGNDLPYMLFLPAYTATAWYHRKLSPDLQADFTGTLAQVEKWALTEYNGALAMGDELSQEERKAVAGKLSSFTGLSAEFVENSDLRVGQMQFSKELLRDENRTVGRLDSRFKGIDGDFAGCYVEYDPVLFLTKGAYGTAMEDYARTSLGFESDLAYEALSDKVIQAWNWHSGIEGRQGYVNVSDSLRQAMTKNRDLKLLIASGYYDLGTPYFVARYTANHLGLDPAFRDHITLAIYHSGHQIYVHPPSLKKLAVDAAAFYRSAVPAE